MNFLENITTEFKKEYTCSLLSQLEQSYNFIDMYNRTRSEFEGLKRMDMRDYPIEAVKETLLNCIMHRNYLFSGSTLISIFDDRIEFVTLGGFVRGISTYIGMLINYSFFTNAIHPRPIVNI